MARVKSFAALTAYLVTISPFFGTAQNFNLRYRNFYKLTDKYLVGSVTETRKVKDFGDCSLLCAQHGYAPFSCLSFNFGKTSDDNGYYTCELSNSERYLQPLTLNDRPNYDYYGTASKSVLRIMPCASSPCNYGGTCINGLRFGEFSCQCGVEITVLPFLDKKCNIDTNAMTISSPVEGVFQAKVGRYNLNYYDAQRFCEIHGATLATYNQLYAAWEAGLEKCEYGWLADSTVRYPMQGEYSGCENKIGIIGSSTPEDKTNKYNAWCYKK
ncbi:hypothetical protein ACROYT_G020083 [Oculina patagonica]